MLGEQGQLMPIYEKAKQRAAEREAAVSKKNLKNLATVDDIHNS